MNKEGAGLKAQRVSFGCPPGTHALDMKNFEYILNF
jgi:hypothetical protein